MKLIKAIRLNVAFLAVFFVFVPFISFASSCFPQSMFNLRTFQCGFYTPCDEHGDISPHGDKIRKIVICSFCH